MINDLIGTGMDDLLVNDFLNNGVWTLPNSISSVLADKIKAVIISEKNQVCWNGSFKWAFNIFIDHYYSHLSKVIWYPWIWHKHFSLKFACFSWMAVVGKLKTADNLLLRGIQIPINCSLCSGNLENHSHLFFECDFSFFIATILLPDINAFLLRPNLQQLLDFFGNAVGFCKTEKNYCFLIISCMIYYIWKERNLRCFSADRNNITKIICNIKEAVRFKTSKWKNLHLLHQRFSGF